MRPVILGFTSKIQVDAHLDDKAYAFTDVRCIVQPAHLCRRGWESPTIRSAAQMHCSDGHQPEAKFD